MSAILTFGKRLLPDSWKLTARRLHRRYVFRRTMRRLLDLPPTADPTSELLADLVYGWGNEGFSALPDYIATFLRCARDVEGPILECGSGLSTVLLGIVAQHAGKRVWSLEHNALWAAKVYSTLDRYRITSVELCVATLRDYGPFTWYDPPQATMPHDFALVVCDGPPGDTPGGRGGLLSVLQAHLKPGCIILLDDADRPREKDVISRWSRQLGVPYTLSPTNKPFGTLVVPRSAA